MNEGRVLIVGTNSQGVLYANIHVVALWPCSDSTVREAFVIGSWGRFVNNEFVVEKDHRPTNVKNNRVTVDVKIWSTYNNGDPLYAGRFISDHFTSVHRGKGINPTWCDNRLKNCIVRIQLDKKNVWEVVQFLEEPIRKKVTGIVYAIEEGCARIKVPGWPMDFKMPVQREDILGQWLKFEIPKDFITLREGQTRVTETGSVESTVKRRIVMLKHVCHVEDGYVRTNRFEFVKCDPDHMPTTEGPIYVEPRVLNGNYSIYHINSANSHDTILEEDENQEDAE